MLVKLHHTLSSSMISSITLGLMTGIMGAALISSSANALEPNHTEDTHTHESSSDANHERKVRTEIATNIAERRAAANEKLSAAKLKACEKREANVNKQTERIAERATKQLAVFTKISDRVQTFYATKGYSVDNYDELVQEVNTAKTAAETTVAGVSTNKASFDCENNPRQNLETFKESLKASNTALKAYRTSVKNLIVAIKSANSADKQSNSSTQEPTGEAQ